MARTTKIGSRVKKNTTGVRKRKVATKLAGKKKIAGRRGVIAKRKTTGTRSRVTA